MYHHHKDTYDGNERVLAIQALSESWPKSFAGLKQKHCR
ncbi:MAG TPA: hypothetical protein DDX85_13325 [Nitrospiraceae bacterium]|nr:hypothetical protein [Nitrospiraceae bacterium]